MGTKASSHSSVVNKHKEGSKAILNYKTKI